MNKPANKCLQLTPAAPRAKAKCEPHPLGGRVHFPTVDDPELGRIRADLERRPRLRGQYIIDMVTIPTVPSEGPELEEVLESLFQHFDDQEWPPASERPDDHGWTDYECSSDDARQHTIDALVGGSEIGHVRVTLSPMEAAGIWSRFEALLPQPRRYYTGMGLGDPRFTFQHGAVVVGPGTAAILWIVESD